MADKTTHFGLNLPLGTEIVDNDMLNENFSKLDTEVFKRGKAVNGIEVNENGDFILEEVPYARDIVTDQQQSSSGEYLFRTTGGTASLSDGEATLIGVHGRMEHVGRADEVLDMTVHNEPRQAQEGEETPGEITATLNRATFIAYVENPASITVTLTYTDAWSANPSLYGVTVEGTPINGDSITIVYVRADRGVITPSHPTKFRSTGWNLYNNDVGYARVKKYSERYNFIVGGTYTELKFSETLDGVRSAVTVTSNRFSIPSDGYIWVTGGNNVTTYILMTWSDWTSGPEGSWKAYEETAVDFGSIMENNFPYGLCKVGAVIDEINMRGLTFTRRIDRTAYSETTIAQLEQAGTEYIADRDYIYFVMATPVTGTITLTNTYTANDHGLEIIDSETDTAPFVQTLYGENLVEKLRTDIPNQITALGEDVSNTQDGMAILAIGNTHEAIANGQAVYVKNHITLDDGLYWAKAAIAADAALSTSNLTPDSSGGLNKLKSDIDTLNSNLMNLVSVGMQRVATGADADTLYPDNQRVGFYAVSYQVANIPSSGWYFLLSFRAEANYITQVAFGMTVADVHWRRFNIGTTGATWSKIA